ncbi:MAG: D-TA family PLP-dependent enzyme [Cyclobacteriaceae bacterium]
MPHWFEIANADEVLSPALLFYPERIQQNIGRMIAIAGSADRLRPHVKTYKCREVVNMQMEKDISKFKCATLAEAEMVAQCGARDVLLAYPLVGPNQKRFIQLMAQFQKTRFSVLVDHAQQIAGWKSLLGTKNTVQVFIDLDAGMHRTGTVPEQADALVSHLDDPAFLFRGWHCYDGHIHQSDFAERQVAVDQQYKSILDLINRHGLKDKEFICGSSISFPIHAQRPGRTLSPGTTLLWDHGYSTKFPDLHFDVAAILLARVVTKPGEDLLCIDLGYKAVASEMKEAPVFFPQIPDAEIQTHSEEHLVIKTAQAQQWQVGDVVYGIPWHICPTVAMYDQAGVVVERSVNEYWPIAARNRFHQLHGN